MSYLINITYNDLPARMGGILVQNVTCFGNRGAEADAQVRHDVEMIVSCVDPGAIFILHVCCIQRRVTAERGKLLPISGLQFNRDKS